MLVHGCFIHFQGLPITKYLKLGGFTTKNYCLTFLDLEAQDESRQCWFFEHWREIFFHAPRIWWFATIFDVPWLVDALSQSTCIFSWHSPCVLSLHPDFCHCIGMLVILHEGTPHLPCFNLIIQWPYFQIISFVRYWASDFIVSFQGDTFQLVAVLELF